MAKISVLMPAYNCEKYIDSSIKSILFQTFTDYELIILNDGSLDNTEQVILSINDKRIRYYKNEKNKGLTYTRNMLIKLAETDYLAFLDSDDLAEPERLEKEYNLLKSDKDLAFVSSSFKAINEKGELIKSNWHYDLSSDQLKTAFLFYNPVATSSVMVKKQCLPEIVFREGYPVCEDYDLWTRIMLQYKARVMPDYLTKYRLYEESICKQQPDNIIRVRNKIITNQLECYFPGEYTEQEKQLQLSLVEFSLHNKIEDLDILGNWVHKFIGLNRKHRHFDETILKQLLYERLLKKLLRLEAYDLSVFKKLRQLKKELQPHVDLELRQKELAILAFSLAGRKFIQV